MADPRSIHEFTTGEVEATTLLLGDFVDLDAQSGYTTYKASVSDIGEVILEDIEYTQDLQTTDKTVVGAINENKSVIGYSYDEYDDTTTSANAYAVDDLCIRNNTLYKCIAPTYGAWDSSKWELTSIADEIERIDTALSGKMSKSVTVSNGTYQISVGNDKELKISEDDIRIEATGYFQASSNVTANTSLFWLGKSVKTSGYVRSTVAIAQGSWVNFTVFGYKA